MKLGKLKIEPLFAWYDLWTGFYWDHQKKVLYWLPIPMFGLKFSLKKPRIQRLPVEGSNDFFFVPYIHLEMTLEDAIKHAREKAAGKGRCAEDHQRLAEWLEELRSRRENDVSKPKQQS